VTAFPYNSLDRLSIIDPNNAENDIAGGSKNFSGIVDAFADAHQLLRARMLALRDMPDRHGASILEVILAGNYSSFRLQREHLQKLADRGLNYESQSQGKGGRR
jgi:non-canonical poly(A) RNA polymerase PAPD5/7